MENITVSQKISNFNQMMGQGKPTIPSGKQPVIERKFCDPSSSYPKGERYPIPASFEYRVKTRELETL